MPWRQRILLAALLLLATLAIVWAFLPRPVPVDTATVSRGPLRVTWTRRGRPAFWSGSSFPRRSPGTRGGWGSRSGSRRQGQALATLEPLRAEALDPRTRAIAEARAATAEAALRAAGERVREAAASEEYAVARLDRTRKLAEAGLTPRDTLEQSNRRPSAPVREGIRDGSGRRRTARGGSGEGSPDQGRRVGGKGREKMIVRSPIAGRVLAVRHESEGVVPAGTPLLDVGDPGRLEVEVDVLSADAVRIHPGTPVRFERWGARASGREGPGG